MAGSNFHLKDKKCRSSSSKTVGILSEHPHLMKELNSALKGREFMILNEDLIPKSISYEEDPLRFLEEKELTTIDHSSDNQSFLKATVVEWKNLIDSLQNEFFCAIFSEEDFSKTFVCSKAADTKSIHSEISKFLNQNGSDIKISPCVMEFPKLNKKFSDLNPEETAQDGIWSMRKPRLAELKGETRKVICQSYLLDESQYKLLSTKENEVLSDVKKKFQVKGILYQLPIVGDIPVVFQVNQLTRISCVEISDPESIPLDSLISVNWKTPQSTSDYDTIEMSIIDNYTILKKESWNLPVNHHITLLVPDINKGKASYPWNFLFEKCLKIVSKDDTFPHTIGISIPTEISEYLEEFCQSILTAVEKLPLNYQRPHYILLFVKTSEMMRDVIKILKTPEQLPLDSIGAFPKGKAESPQENEQKQTTNWIHEQLQWISFLNYSTRKETLDHAIMEFEKGLKNVNFQVSFDEAQDIFFFYDLIPLVPDIVQQLDLKQDNLSVPKGSSDQFKRYLTEFREQFQKEELDIPTNMKVSHVKYFLIKIRQQCPAVKCKITNKGQNVVFKALNFDHVKEAKCQLESFFDLRKNMSTSEDQFNTNKQEPSEFKGANTPAPLAFEPEQTGASSSNPQKNEDNNCFQTENGLLVKVYQGNILKVDVDGIVNIANKRLSHGAGVARAIINAAGDTVNREGQSKRKDRTLDDGEELSTSAGNLQRYKNIIHAVGPRFSATKSNDYCGKKVAETVYNSLEEANKLSLRSVALPAISSAIFGVPLDVCAAGYFLGVKEFCKRKTRTCELKEVHFVDLNPDACKAIKDYFANQMNEAPLETNWNNIQQTKTNALNFPNLEQFYGANTNVDHVPEANSTASFSFEPEQTGASSSNAKKNEDNNCFQIADDLLVKVYQGNILKVDVDGIVNIANKRLSHGAGVARAIINAAGDTVNREGQSKRKDRTLDDGEVLSTSAGNLQRYKNIIHAVGPRFSATKSNDYCGKKVAETVYNSLEEANKLSLRSVALPAISFAIFGVPLDVCAAGYFLGVKEFCKRKTRTCELKEVHFVDLNPDACKAIKDYFANQMNEAPLETNWNNIQQTKTNALNFPNLEQFYGANTNVDHVPEANSTASFSFEPEQTGASSSNAKKNEDNNCFQIADDLLVKVYQGNILKVDVDGIVNIANKRLSHGAGVAREIINAAGDTVNRERQSKRKDRTLDDGEVLSTSAGNLQRYKNIIHAVGPRFSATKSNDYCGKKVAETVYNSLEEANKLSLRSVALPAISFAIFGVPLDVCAAGYFLGVKEFCKRKTRTCELKEVHFVDLNPDACKAIKDYFANQMNESPLETNWNNIQQTKANALNFPNLEQFYGANTNVDHVQEAKTTASFSFEPEQTGASSSNPQKNEDNNCFQTEYGLLVKVYQGNILNVDVDGIVNADDKWLSHGGGVAGAIIKAAGDTVNREGQSKLKGRTLNDGEILSTSAGNLKRYKNIIHAVGPMFSATKSNDYCRKKVAETVYNSLEEANKLSLRSVALPAISSAIFGVPLDVCAAGYFLGVKEFCKRKTRTCELKEVHFVDLNPDACKAIKDYFANQMNEAPLETNWNNIQQTKTNALNFPNLEQFYGANTNVDHVPEANSTASFSFEPEQTGASSSNAKKNEDNNCFQIADDLLVKVYQGNILKVDVDGIVNIANKRLSHGAGVARAIINAAGDTVNRERQSKRKDRTLDDGEVLSTSAGNLQRYKNIIHAVGPRFSATKSNDYCGKKVAETVYNSLEEANKLSLRSVALPAISFAIFGVPLDVCAAGYFLGVKEFCKRKTRTCELKEVHFVDLNPDACKAIKDYFANQMNEAPLETNWNNIQQTKTNALNFPNLEQFYGANTNVDHVPEANSTASFSFEPEQTGASSSNAKKNEDNNCFQIADDLLVKVYQGNILKVDVDGIVNIANKRLSHGAGVARAIINAAGDTVNREGQSKRKDRTLDDGEVLSTSAGNLQRYKNIIHAVGPRFSATKSNDYCGKKVAETVYNSLEEANKLSLRSVALPAISFAIFGVPLDVCAAGYFLGVKEFCKRKTQTCELKEVHFVDLNPDACKAIKDYFANQMNESPLETNWNNIQQTKANALNFPNLEQFYGANTNVDHVQEAKTTASFSFEPEQTGASSSNPQKNEDNNCFQTEYGLLVKVYQGNILNVDVDGIVNADDKWLSHGGGVAGAIIKAAGDTVNREGQSKLKGRTLNDGEILSTSAGNLKRYKNIIHAVGPMFSATKSNDYCRKKVAETVYNSLEEANKLSLRSVALPAISSVAGSAQQEGCTVEVIKGLITDQKADVVVCSTNKSLMLNAGKVSLALSDKAGPGLQRECSKQYPKGITFPEIVFTKGYNLLCDYVFYGALPYNDGNPNISTFVENCLEKAARLNISSITFPALGTGNLKYEPEDAASQMASAISGFKAKTRQSSLKKIIIVIYPDKKEINDFSKWKEMFVKPEAIFGVPLDVCTYGYFRGFMDFSKTKAPNCPLKEVHFVDLNPVTCKAIKDYFAKQMNEATMEIKRNNIQQAKDITKNDENTCPVCFEEMSKPHLLKCKHVCCPECVKKLPQPLCPICRLPFGPVYGNQPDGTMRVDLLHESLPGFHETKTHHINYTMGTTWPKTKRDAYLPQNKKGDIILKMLQLAFKQRLIFTVGESRISSHQNAITWNEIHHKTSKTGGPSKYGYPDSDYLSRVMVELADKGITPDLVANKTIVNFIRV